MPEIKPSSLSEISLGILASINDLNKKKERLIEIAEDGKLSEDEIPDFIAIKDKLDKLSITIDSLKLWMEQALANNEIDPDTLKKFAN